MGEFSSAIWEGGERESHPCLRLDVPSGWRVKGLCRDGRTEGGSDEQPSLS